MVWFTNERRLALFPAGTIVRDPHHPHFCVLSPKYLLNFPSNVDIPQWLEKICMFTMPSGKTPPISFDYPQAERNHPYARYIFLKTCCPSTESRKRGEKTVDTTVNWINSLSTFITLETISCRKRITFKHVQTATSIRPPLIYDDQW